MKSLKIFAVLGFSIVVSSCKNMATPAQLDRVVASHPQNLDQLMTRLSKYSSSDAKEYDQNLKENRPGRAILLRTVYYQQQATLKMNKHKIHWYNYYPGVEKNVVCSIGVFGADISMQTFGGGMQRAYDFMLDKNFNILGYYLVGGERH